MTNKPTRLSAGAFDELRKVAQEEIKESMTDQEIEEMGIRLLNLFDILMSPESVAAENQLTDQELKALKFLEGEINQGRSPSVRDLSRAMGFRSSRSGFRFVNKLMSAGRISRDRRGKLVIVRCRDGTI